jgi:hypothetical protein
MQDLKLNNYQFKNKNMETNDSFSRLRELRGSGYEIVDGEPDIIGWSIRDAGDRKLGVVHDLLFEPEQQKVRYIIANLKDNDFDLDRRKVLIPIGVAQLHENNDNVILNAVSPWQIRALPAYDKHMTAQDEGDIFTIFSTTNSTIATTNSQLNQNLYEHTNYNYDNLFRNRQKGKPSDRKFGIRQRETSSLDSMRDYERENRYANEPEEMAVRNENDRYHDSEYLRDDETKKERLIDRIKHMKDDLNQIERDLRNSRDI